MEIKEPPGGQGLRVIYGPSMLARWVCTWPVPQLRAILLASINGAVIAGRWSAGGKHTVCQGWILSVSIHSVDYLVKTEFSIKLPGFVVSSTRVPWTEPSRPLQAGFSLSKFRILPRFQGLNHLEHRGDCGREKSLLTGRTLKQKTLEHANSH